MDMDSVVCKAWIITILEVDYLYLSTIDFDKIRVLTITKLSNR